MPADRLLTWLQEIVDPSLVFEVDESATPPAELLTIPYRVKRTLNQRLFNRGEPPDAEARVLETISVIAHGNPGVAKRLWLHLRDSAEPELVISTSQLSDVGIDLPELTYDQAFALQLLVSNESMTKPRLEEVVGKSLDRTLRLFVDEGLIRRNGHNLSLDPLAVYVIVDELEKRRMIW